ncbi:MAG: hypothetical protein JWM11_1477 [Planctomycetaceae bacterium]|nr:hypothetical protein [Planctomycetaceae bacterium]
MTLVHSTLTSRTSSHVEPVRRRAGWLARRLAQVAVLIVLICGCHLSGKKDLGLPGRHSLRADQLVVLSDFKLQENHPLIQDLVKLRSQVSRVLKLPLKTEDVTVYLFSDELAYHQYLQTAHPGLPSRRAYFIATEAELAVYTYWGDRIQEDLRHEYTHGLLHAGLKTVPLWLDEGLAEYFEVAGPRPGNIQPDYVHRLTLAIQNGWRPDLTRLEALDKIELMHRAEYRESWAWVHFMLHSSPETRQVLLQYVNELQTDRNPEPISTRLAREIPVCEARMLSYLAGLNTHSHVAGQ